MIDFKKIVLIASYIVCGLSFAFFITSFAISYNQRNDAFKQYNELQVKENDSTLFSTSAIRDIHPIEKLVFTGDKFAYDIVFKAFKSSDRMDEAFVFSIVMAYKYNYSQAFYDIFENFNSLYGDNSLDSLDEYSRDFAIKCLFRASEMGNVKAKNELLK